MEKDIKPNINLYSKVGGAIYFIYTINNQKENGAIIDSVGTANSNPLMISISTRCNSLTTENILASKKFCLTGLDINTPNEFITNFGAQSGRNANKFEFYNKNFAKESSQDLKYHLTNAVFYISCELFKVIKLTDHYTLIAKVISWDIVNNAKSLLMYDDYLKRLGKK